ncbi:cell division protein FtsQ [Clostridium algifaecis]|uniref:Cell division protein FtsQ n=1 Tax=Clostridium algifaecis TaxID=1472040 RepID=A0ABS4KPN3_9CLOT|nr:FtsQ-type POTRA domain-containing protein [Clostridium algifaecis]MBP2031436.1 cell division protein FtsQ [Clostridium algifaecis]
MGNALVKTENELILNRRRRKRIRKIFLLFIFLISVLFILLIKLPYFNIKNIKVYGNKNIQDNKIIELSNIYKGNNIFYINLNSSKKNILSDPYIDKVTITRKLPSQININVVERDAVFYININKDFYVINEDGIVLQKRDSVDNMKLVELDGINPSSTKVGNVIKTNDNRKIDAIHNIGDLIKDSKTSFDIKSIDVSNSLDIKAFRSNMCIKLGSADDMQEKLNKALNIIQQEKLNDSRGYIDVRFDGNPAFSVDNK